MRALVVALFILSGFSALGDEFRDFMSTDGKSMRGQVLRIDAVKKTVTIKRDNGRSATVPMAVFSAADQQYFKEWMKLEGVRSPSKLKFICERRKVKSWSEVEGVCVRLYTKDSSGKSMV